MPALLLDGPAKASARRVPSHHADKCICSGAGASTHFGEHPLLENPEIGEQKVVPQVPAPQTLGLHQESEQPTSLCGCIPKRPRSASRQTSSCPILSLLLLGGFFGATKVLPMVLDLVVLWLAITDRMSAPATG
jgi:hypothetical protein